MKATALCLHKNRGDGWAEDDRLWFAERPHRKHRIRPLDPDEYKMLTVYELPPGWRWYTVVQQVVPAVRLRLPIGLGPGEPAQGEHAAARLFEIARERTGVFPALYGAVERA